MKKEHQIIMLPSEKPSQILFDTVGGKLVYNPPVPQEKTVNVKPQHLYILSNEEIKEGDWFYDDLDIPNNMKVKRLKNAVDYSLIREDMRQSEKDRWFHAKKIIATTDPKLHTNEIVEEDMHMYKKSLPQIPQSFIEEYCKAGGIDEVLVEVEVETRVFDNLADLMSPMSTAEYSQTTTEIYKGIKLNPDNHIIIHPVEDKMYSGEELYFYLSEFGNYLRDNYYGVGAPKLIPLKQGLSSGTVNEILDKWIEENL